MKIYNKSVKNRIISIFLAISMVLVYSHIEYGNSTVFAADKEVNGFVNLIFDAEGNSYSIFSDDENASCYIEDTGSGLVFYHNDSSGTTLEDEIDGDAIIIVSSDLTLQVYDADTDILVSEALEPEQVVEILNEYLSMTTAAIFRNMGTLDKFVGDCTMAVFNSPFDLPDYEYKAVSAALDIVNDGKALQESLLKKYGRTIGYGVGVNVGPAVVGNIGCDVRMDFTAIGDTVNTAARLEANAKAGQVLISDVLYERLKGRIEVNGIGEIPLKGKTKGVYVYEVLSLIDDRKDSKEDSKEDSKQDS